MSLLDSIAECQKERGWTDAQLAERLGIHKSVLSRFKTGQRQITRVETLTVLGKVLPEIKWKIAEYVFNGGDN